MIILAVGTRYSGEFPCPAGTYFNLTGNIRIQNCIPCIRGHYCREGSALPTPCQAGTFSTTLGAFVSQTSIIKQFC